MVILSYHVNEEWMNEWDEDFKGYIDSDQWHSTNKVEESAKVQNCPCELGALLLRWRQASTLSDTPLTSEQYVGQSKKNSKT